MVQTQDLVQFSHSRPGCFSGEGDDDGVVAVDEFAGRQVFRVLCGVFHRWLSIEQGTDIVSSNGVFQRRVCGNRIMGRLGPIGFQFADAAIISGS
jgi:hypothetical protein